MTEVNLNVTIKLSERLEIQIERLIELLTTATHQYQEENNDYEDEDDAAS